MVVPKLSHPSIQSIQKSRAIYSAGTMHLAFGIPDIEVAVRRIEQLGGKLLSKIYVMPNGRKCCFCSDPEGNGLELIE